jgi:hypothetical protein
MKAPQNPGDSFGHTCRDDDDDDDEVKNTKTCMEYSVYNAKCGGGYTQKIGLRQTHMDDVTHCSHCNNEVLDSDIRIMMCSSNGIHYLPMI